MPVRRDDPPDDKVPARGKRLEILVDPARIRVRGVDPTCPTRFPVASVTTTSEKAGATGSEKSRRTCCGGSTVASPAVGVARVSDACAGALAGMTSTASASASARRRAVTRRAHHGVGRAIPRAPTPARASATQATIEPVLDSPCPLSAATVIAGAGSSPDPSQFEIDPSLYVCLTLRL